MMLEDRVRVEKEERRSKEQYYRNTTTTSVAADGHRREMSLAGNKTLELPQACSNKLFVVIYVVISFLCQQHKTKVFWLE